MFVLDARCRRARSLLRLVLLVVLCASSSVALAQTRLRVAGATANNEVKLRTTSEDFRTVLRVDLLSPPPGDAGVEEALPGGVTVLVDPLQASDGSQVTLTAVVREAAGAGDAGGSSLPISPSISSRAPLHLEVSGKLPAAGDYTGQLVLVHAGGRETTALVVSRTQAVPAVQFIATSPAVAASGWGLGTVEATVRLPFKETAGVTGKVATPRLLQLQHKAPDLGATLVQPRFGSAHFFLEGGGKDGKDLDLSMVDGTVQVSANGSGTLLLHLRGLDGPGEYTGTVRMAVPQGVAVEQPFTVWVRTPWLWGALLIAAGAVSSYGVRLYTQNIRPRAQQLHRAQVLRQRAAELLNGQDEEARRVGLEVRARIDAIVSRIRGPLRGGRVAEAELARVEPELRLYEAWCAGTRELQALPRELRPAQASKLLDEAETSLRLGNVPTERLEEQLKVLRQQNVEELARAGLKAKLAELETQARALAQKLGEDDSLGFRLMYELLPLLQEVRASLDEGDLSTARQRFERARRSYFDVLCGELSLAVASPRNPRGFTQEEWRELTAEVKDRLKQARARADVSVDEGFRLYQGAYAHYVLRLLKELREALRDARDSASDAQKVELDSAEAKLREAMLALGAESPHAAAAKYREASDLLHHAQTGQVRKRIEALRAEVASKRSSATTDSELHELGHIDSLLNEAQLALKPETLQDADYKADKAAMALQAYPSPQGAGMSGRLGVPTGSEALSFSTPAAPEVPAPTAPTGGSLPTLPEAPSGDADSAGGFSALEGVPLPSPRHLWVVELAMLALLTGVAVVLGLQLLNVFSPTWGGFGAGMTAFLWGFGLHQVGNASFEGLAGLLTRVEGRGGATGGGGGGS
ncbi:hypothetical protein ACN469_33770 [Corallococcus terminator]